MGLLPLQGLPDNTAQYPTSRLHLSALLSMLHRPPLDDSLHIKQSAPDESAQPLTRPRFSHSTMPSCLRMILSPGIPSLLPLKCCHLLLRSKLSTRGCLAHINAYALMYGPTRLSDLPGRSLLRNSALIQSAETNHLCACY